MQMSRKSFLSVADLSEREFADLLERTGALKENIARRSPGNILEKRVIGLLFEKPSTRTRTSFEVAVFDSGVNRFTCNQANCRVLVANR